MNKTYLTHSGAELDEAIDQYQEHLIPVGTLPAQVILNANLNPLIPSVIVDWQYKDENATGIIICRKKGSIPTNPSDGRIADITDTTITSYIDNDFPVVGSAEFSDYVGTIGEPIKWYYRAFPYNLNRQYQTQYQASIELGTSEVNVYYIEDGSLISDIDDYALLDCKADDGTDKPSLIKIIFGRWGTSATTIKDLYWSVKHIDRENNRAYLVLKNSMVGNVELDVAETGWDDSAFNIGNARWGLMNARQFFNSDGAKGQWFTQAHENEPENSYAFSSYDAFLHYFTDGEKDLIQIVSNTRYLATKPYGGGTETVDDKVWLPNTKNYGVEPDSEENGPIFDGFKNCADDRKWTYNVWTSTLHNHTDYQYLWGFSSAGALYFNGGLNIVSNSYYSVRPGLVIPLTTLLQYDAEKSESEGCEVYRVIIPEEELTQIDEDNA